MDVLGEVGWVEPGHLYPTRRERVDEDPVGPGGRVARDESFTRSGRKRDDNPRPEYTSGEWYIKKSQYKKFGYIPSHWIYVFSVFPRLTLEVSRPWAPPSVDASGVSGSWQVVRTHSRCFTSHVREETQTGNEGVHTLWETQRPRLQWQDDVYP